MDDDFDDLGGDELDFEGTPEDDRDALSLLLADNPANEGTAIWE